MANGTRKPMRQGQQNRRGRGRGRKPQNPQSRNLESNGPDVKIRGTAAHIAEKYTALARDAQVIGDSVAGESYLQHAEHYNRIVAANQEQQQAAAAAQSERVNGSGGDRQNTPAESDSRAQPEAAQAEQGNSSASGTGAPDTTADTGTEVEKTVASSSAPSEKRPSGEAGDDEGLARMMARSTSSSGNGADQEKPVKAAKASKASKAKKKDSGSDDAGTDEAPDEATT